MIEQQFLTTFNSISSYSKTARFKDKKSNQIVDFINGMYQGSLSGSMEAEGVGTVIDDQFNFIICSNWNKGKIDGSCFIKLGNQITIWGQWTLNAPKQTACVRIGSYLIFIPYNNNKKLQRPKKCLVVHKGKGKMYITTIQKYPEGTQNKRQYSIIIQKIISMRKSSILNISSTIDVNLKQHQLQIIDYLNYMNQNMGVIRMNNLNKGIFINARLVEDNQRFANMSLGLLLDRKKLSTKSVGIFIQKQVDQSKQNTNFYQRQRNSTEVFNKDVVLNGLGLSKTLQTQKVIGVFKDDMLVRQINSQLMIQTIRMNSKNYGRNLNGSIVRQLLGHQHMRSLSYQHNYIYFPEIKKIVTLAVELNKYVQMFERLAPQNQSESEQNDSIQHFAQKYNDEFTKQAQMQIKDINILPRQSDGSIMDEYPQFKINLRKDIYANKPYHPAARTRTSPNKHIMIQDQNLNRHKKPGFILHRSPTPKGQQNQKSRQVSKSPKSPLKLNKKMPRSSPKKQYRQPQWRK